LAPAISRFSFSLDPAASAFGQIGHWSGHGRRAGFDPNVWSGRALQEALSTWLMRSCINVSGLCLERVVLRAIMDISAHAI
jgi:hypothetical protein